MRIRLGDPIRNVARKVEAKRAGTRIGDTCGTGVVRSCQRSALGAAPRRAARGVRSSTRMAAAAAGKAAIAASAFTDPKRNEGL